MIRDYAITDNKRQLIFIRFKLNFEEGAAVSAHGSLTSRSPPTGRISVPRNEFGFVIGKQTAASLEKGGMLTFLKGHCKPVSDGDCPFSERIRKTAESGFHELQ